MTYTYIHTSYTTLTLYITCTYTAKAGWAHSVLFAAELPSFRNLLPDHIQRDMRKHAMMTAEKKSEKKVEKRRIVLEGSLGNCDKTVVQKERKKK